MTFITKQISSRVVGVIDLGSHKIKVGIYSILGDKSELLGYGEKRQDSEYSYFGECINIEGVCSNIKQAILKAEKEANKKISEIIINFPFEEVFFCHKKINHNRKNKLEIISNLENKNILNKIDNFSIDSSIKDISYRSSYLKSDLKQIIHNVSNINIDNIHENDILGKTGENISFSILNIFVPISKYNILHYIGNTLNKKILKIVPIEFSLISLFKNYKDLVIIDIGNSHISIIIKKCNDLIGVSKIPLGINDLIKDIQKNKNITKIEIINSIDKELFLKEKKHFLSAFNDCLIVGLKEILGMNICPHNFFITGGGGNTFVTNYLRNTNLSNNNLNILNNINIIKYDDYDLSPGNKKITTNIISLSKILPYII